MDAEMREMFDRLFSEIGTVKNEMDRRFNEVDKRLNSMNTRLDNVDARLDRLEDNVEIIKEDAQITRAATNTLLEWAEQAQVEVKIPLYKKAE